MYALLTAADLKRGPTVRDVNLDTLLPDGAFDNNKLLIWLDILLTRNVVQPCRCEFTVDGQDGWRRFAPQAITIIAFHIRALNPGLRCVQGYLYNSWCWRYYMLPHGLAPNDCSQHIFVLLLKSNQLCAT